MAKTKKLTAEQIDKDIIALGDRTLVPVEDVPDYIDTTGIRVVSETIHEGAIRNPGMKITYFQRSSLIDRFLDKRNEVSPPVTKMADLND